MERIKSRKERIQELLGSATSTGRKEPSSIITLEAFIICTVGSTFPSQTTNTIFGILSLAFLTALGYSLICNWTKLAAKKKRIISGAVLAAFLVSGCSGLSLNMFSDPPEPLIVLQNHKEYKTAQLSGMTFFGFGWDSFSVEKVMKHGNIEKAFAVQQQQSFGIVSMSYVKVYGQ